MSTIRFLIYVLIRLITDVDLHSIDHCLASDSSQHPGRYCSIHKPGPVLLHDMPSYEGAYLASLLSNMSGPLLDATPRPRGLAFAHEP